MGWRPAKSHESQREFCQVVLSGTRQGRDRSEVVETVGRLIRNALLSQINVRCIPLRKEAVARDGAYSSPAFSRFSSKENGCLIS